MDSNHYNSPWAAHPSSQAMSFPQQTVPSASGNYEEYNTQWGQEDIASFLQHVNEIDAPSTSTTVNATEYNEYLQCQWLTGGAFCGRFFASFDDLIIHLGAMHDVQGPAARRLLCGWLTGEGPCDRQYRRDGFRRHIGTHLGLSVACPGCGKAFSREDSMRAHFKKVHEKK